MRSSMERKSNNKRYLSYSENPRVASPYAKVKTMGSYSRWSSIPSRNVYCRVWSERKCIVCWCSTRHRHFLILQSLHLHDDYSNAWKLPFLHQVQSFHRWKTTNVCSEATNIVYFAISTPFNLHISWVSLLRKIHQSILVKLQLVPLD